MLRHFVTVAARPHTRATTGDPVVVVGSGKGGTGGSTVTALLGIACATAGRRTLLVDGDEQVGILHRLFGVAAPHGLEGLRAGATTPANCVVALDQGLAVLPGGSGADDSGRRSVAVLSAAERRALFRRVAHLYREYDVVIVDAGSRLDTVMAAVASGARRVVVVGGDGAVALAAGYALIKAIELKWPGTPVDVIANRQDEVAGQRAFDQLQHAASRFLGRDLDCLGAIPDDAALDTAIRTGQSLHAVADVGVAGQAVRELAHRLLIRLGDGTRQSAAPGWINRRR
jgi:flagellar biosynthesis protein FlhG